MDEHEQTHNDGKSNQVTYTRTRLDEPSGLLHPRALRIMFRRSARNAIDIKYLERRRQCKKYSAFFFFSSNYTPIGKLLFNRVNRH